MHFYSYKLEAFPVFSLIYSRICKCVVALCTKEISSSDVLPRQGCDELCNLACCRNQAAGTECERVLGKNSTHDQGYDWL